MPSAPPGAAVLGLTDIDVRFGATHALRGVSLSVLPGECVALAGQNGAGKSTLVKIITGVYPQSVYSGTVTLDGEVVRFRTPGEAESAGVAVVQQELTVCSNLSVAENLLIGHEPTRLGFIRRDRLRAQAARMLQAVGLDLPLDVLAGKLSVGQQQMLEIARAVSRRAKVLVLDEPTSSLSTSEAEALFRRLAELKSRGVCVLYISHRLDELQRVADRVVVLRDGAVVLDEPIAKAGRDTIVESMLGEQPAAAGSHPLPAGLHGRPPVLSITNWSVPPVHPSDPVIDSIELSVAPGEIAGIYGAVGSGRSELVMSLYGSRASTGQMLLDGKPISIASPREAVAAGVALVSEDRKVMGLEPWMSTAANITLPVLRAVSRGAVPHEARESRFAHDQAGSVGLPARMVAQQIVTLSGGNQQKGMLARALASKPRLLLLDEPTRGVDVGAKSDLHATLRELAAEGIAVVWVSSEAEELVEVAHRTHVMRDGKMVASFEAGDTSVAALVTAASSRDELAESKD